MATHTYFFDDGQSRKFWSYTLRGKKQTIRHGRIGTAGREAVKEFGSPAEAKAATLKLAQQKVSKRYVKVDPDRLEVARPKGKRAATEAQVARLEKHLGYKLPKDYRRFLLTQNGGQPTPEHVELPLDYGQDTRPVGFLFGLYPKPEPDKSLWFAIEENMPSMPEGHLPVCGLFSLYYYSISLADRPGCVYFWNEDAGGYGYDDEGRPLFDDSHAVLVAGSFDEFLTRIAICEVEAEEEEPEGTASVEPYHVPVPELRCAGRLSKRRREEIMQLVYQEDEERPAIERQAQALLESKSWKKGQELWGKYHKKMKRRTMNFVKQATDKVELQYFVENWNWDAGTEPMLELVKNPHADAGTLLQVYWGTCPEDYALFHATLSELDTEDERTSFRIQRAVERRFAKGDYKTASFPFDPTPRTSMRDRRDEFARQIPDVMYEPIGGGKKRNR